MNTRVVAPLLAPGEAGQPMRGLNPEIMLDGARLVLMPQLAATLTRAELGERVGSAVHARDEIVRAVDMLLAGV